MKNSPNEINSKIDTAEEKVSKKRKYPKLNTEGKKRKKLRASMTHGTYSVQMYKSSLKQLGNRNKTLKK